MVLGPAVPLPATVTVVTTNDVVPCVDEFHPTGADLDGDHYAVILVDPRAALVGPPFLGGPHVAQTHKASVSAAEWQPNAELACEFSSLPLLLNANVVTKTLQIF
jgi:hypothetical protein